MAKGEISFGRFRLDSARRELRRGNERVQLGGRALDILCVLASAEGAVVTKDELMARVWRGVVVEENNLQVHISALRKVLYEDWGRERLDRDRPAARLPAPRLTAAGVLLTD